MRAFADFARPAALHRPYRAGMAPEQAFGLLAKDRGTKLCPVAIDALAAVIAAGDGVVHAAAAA